MILSDWSSRVSKIALAGFLFAGLPCGAQEEATAGGDEVSDAEAQAAWESFLSSFEWKTEGTGDLGKWATIEIPAGYRFVEGEGSRGFLQGLGNLMSYTPDGLVGPDDLDWFVVFSFTESGYVKDDEKDELDADKLFAEMKENEKVANEMRLEQGLDTLTMTGWAREPFYNDQTNNLEWGVVLQSGDGGVSVNYETKLLGRRGVMDVTLVCDPEDLDALLPTYQDLLLGYAYTSGNKYEEFVDGDKLAEYGLTGLIVGGGAVVAAKAGLFAVLGKFFAKMWKLIVVGVIAIGAVLKKIFSRGNSGYTQG